MTGSAARKDGLPIALSDLIAITVFTALTGAFVFVEPLNQTPLRSLFALVFLLFVPGYTIAVALIPGRTGTENQATETSEMLLEYVVIAFGISVSLTVLTGLALGFTSTGITPVRLYSVLGLVTVAWLPIAAIRRSGVPSENQVRHSLSGMIHRFRSKFSTNQPTHVLVLNLAVVATIIIATVSVGAGFDRNNEADLTEFYLLSENDTGEFVAADYPTSLTRGTTEPFVLGIHNLEGEPINYTVVVLLQRFEANDGTETLITETELQSVERSIENEKTEQINMSVTPPTTGSGYRLTFLLYTGQSPSNPSTDNAYREVHLWVDITPQPQERESMIRLP